jgi:lysophospholipase L1-like esterase
MSREPGVPQFSLRRSILYSLVICVAFFGVAEVLLRILGVSPPVPPRILLRAMDTDIRLPFMGPDPEVFWSPIPGWRGRFRGRSVTINALGLRGPEVRAPKPPGQRRLVCFGDSITFGFGAGDDETYPFDLGRELANRGVDVVNAGVTGFTSHQVLGLLRRLLPVLDPDVVTLCIGWNDGNKRPADDREYARRLRLIMSIEGPFDHVYLYKAAKSLYVGAFARKVTAPIRTEVRGPRVTLTQYRENLEEIVRLCRARGARPVFLGLPRRKRGDEVLQDPIYARAFAETARALDVPLLDSGDLGVDPAVSSNEQYFIDGLHFSPSGSELMARQIARQLVALGIL